MPATSLIRVLELDRSGMETVREATQKGDDEFYEELLAYYRRRADELWFPPPPPRNPDYQDEVAELCLAKTIPVRDGKHYIDMSGGYDWLAAPAGDLEDTCQLTRQAYLVNLANAWWHTQRPEYAQEALAMFDDFITHVLPVEHDLVNYWQIKRSGWRPLEVAIRLQSWFNALGKLIRSPEFPTRLWARILFSIYQHAEYLLRYRWDHGNHAFSEATTEVFAGILWPEFKQAKQWLEDGRRFLIDSFDKQHYPDGVCTEMSLGYHRSVPTTLMDWMELLSYKGRDDLLPDELREKVHTAVRADMKTIKPDGTVAHFNDTQTGSHLAFLARGADLFEDPELQYAATQGQSGQEPDFTSTFLPDGRWVTMRTGWDRAAWHLIFDAGPVGIAHQNPNALSCEVYAYGKTLLTNNGPFRYSTSPEADWHRWSRYFRDEARANNTLTLRGQSQLLNDTTGDMVLHPQFDYAWGIRRGFTDAADVTHIRQILFVKGRYWLIRDLVIGEGQVEPEVYWHLEPGEHHFDANAGVLCSAWGGPNVTLAMPTNSGLTLEVVEGRDEPIDGWFSSRYEEKVPAPVLIASRMGKPPLSFETAICPGHEDAPRIEVERIAEDGTGIALMVRTERGTDWALFNCPNTEREMQSLGPWQTDAECLWIEGGDESLRVWASGLSRLYHEQQCVLECDGAIRGIELRPSGEGGYKVMLADWPTDIRSEVSLRLA